ncbi:MAG: acyltransferase [Reyranella sp.]|jgi:hypothetical protein|uniref:acyltransferase family protein n=1 Tax=Reyranella sp. TaxID=1929291 RepID=UPI00095C105A|nr:acyltransferase [Reyranella sp.]MBN9538076.1 acyltransferase [Alphaproteobacteria bacterium]MBR2814220.1 acyltransferase [Reyranella sp.]OJU33108.1 MAG: hypothetical protein BGN99_23770 [Alphaproteobacteria bacterium 65-37]
MAERRTDLDWLRIGAFAILILFHVGMFYAPAEWEVKSPRIVPWLAVVLEWSAPWRLLLLFMISGAATSFMCRRMAPRELFVARSVFLLPPLLFAVIAVSPPQLYVKAIEQFRYHGDFWRFLPRYFDLRHRLCNSERCLQMPNWEHLWFVAYLWIYTTLLALGLGKMGRLSSVPSFHRILRGWRLLVVPSVFLTMMRIGLEHFFPETHGLVDDWYLHAVFFSAFLFGFTVLRDNSIMRTLESLRWLALGVGITAFILRSTYTWEYHDGASIPIALKVVMAFAYGFDQWSWVVAALGFASRHLRGRDGAVRQYLTEAIFPYYIIHQLIIVLAAHELTRLALPLALEAFVLVILCVVGCVATFELVRRVEWLRPWFGLRPSHRKEALSR